MGGGLTVTGISEFGPTIHATNIRVGEDLIVTGVSSVNKTSPGATPYHGTANFAVGGVITGDVAYFGKLYVTGTNPIKEILRTTGGGGGGGGGGISAAGTGYNHNIGIFTGNSTLTTGQLVYINKGGHDQKGRLGVNNLTPR